MMIEIEQLKIDEGFRSRPYFCSEGHLTIGYGTRLPLTKYESEFVLNVRDISKEDADFLLKHRLTQHVSKLRNIKPIVYKLDENRQGVLYNMSYQLGVDGLLKFKKMWRAIEYFDFDTAAAEMKNSRWYKQTPSRAQRLIQRMQGVINE